jgi:uncharacterized protein (DUF488 family)
VTGAHAPRATRPPVATIGYEGATVDGFLAALRAADVDLLVDVRALAVSRRPGFAKTRLAANLAGAGIEYRHVRALGTPGDGRAAARAGRHEEMRRVFAAHLATPPADAALDEVAALVRDGRRACLLCLEADPAHCHRLLVADALATRVGAAVVHLHPVAADGPAVD